MSGVDKIKRKNDSVRSAENNAAPAANKPRRRNHYFSQPQQLQKQENGFPEEPQSSPDNQNIPPQIVLVDDDFDYDEESREKKSSAPMIVAVVMAVIVVLGAAGFLSYLFLFSDKGGSDNSSSSVHKSDETVPETEEVPSSQPITANVVEKQVTMPDISGLTESEAYKKLNNAGVKYKVKREYSSDVALNMVIAQAPEAGTKFSRSENATVIISKGKENEIVTMPSTSPTTEPSTTEPNTTKPGGSNSSKPDEGTDGYILPGSASEYLSKRDLQGLDRKTLNLALNEIFARHGRIFTDSEISSYFKSKSWYRGTVSPDKFSMSVLNGYESYNFNLILDYQSELGYR